jgi:hypothetical protein
MTTFPWFASLVLAATIVPAPAAETHCPGNVSSVPSLFVNHHQIVLAVSINHTGPYKFLLDSGAQITMIDPSLAAALHLNAQGTTVLAGVGSRQLASFVQLDLIETGSHAVANQMVLVYDLQNLHFDLHLQGILGEDFLEHFDLLIDNSHRLLCLDDSAAMRTEVKGPHIPLLATAEPEGRITIPSLLVITVRLSDALRPVRLLLDSGTNAPLLYNTSQYMKLQFSHDVNLHGTGVDGAQQILSALPPQDVKIGSLELPSVPFLSLGGIKKDAREKGFDGVLPMELFRCVFIDHADHSAVLNPR